MLSVFTIISSIIICIPLVQLQDANSDTMLRVVNGMPAIGGQIPFQISLKVGVQKRRYIEYQSICGGTIIGKKLVLTAAHCLFKERNVCQKMFNAKQELVYELQRMYVVAGSLENRLRYRGEDVGTEQWRRIVKVRAPTNFDFPSNDVAVLHIDPEFLINEHVRALPMAKKDMDYGTIKCQISGFGLTRMGSSYASSELLWATVQLISQKECNFIPGNSGRKFVCISSEPGSPYVLQGDSGGPLMCQNTGDPNDLGQGVVVGIAGGYVLPFFSKTKIPKAFFTKVASYRKFITEAVSDNAEINYKVGINKILIICLCAVYTVYNI